jgi:uncharacterized protein
MSLPELKINVGDLDAGGKHFRFVLRGPWIRGILEDHEATAAGPDGELDVRASSSGTAVVVHGTLKADLTVPCARCLTPVLVTVDEPLSLLFVPGHAPAPRTTEAKASDDRDARRAKDAKKKRRAADEEEYELSSEEADTLPYEGENIILDDVIRDELILETPIFPLCSEDCPGMSPNPLETGRDSQDATQGSGEHAAVDPRLLPLLRLKTKKE